MQIACISVSFGGIMLEGHKWNGCAVECEIAISLKLNSVLAETCQRPSGASDALPTHYDGFQHAHIDLNLNPRQKQTVYMEIGPGGALSSPLVRVIGHVEP